VASVGVVFAWLTVVVLEYGPVVLAWVQIAAALLDVAARATGQSG
jgi:hypothetical protein